MATTTHDIHALIRATAATYGAFPAFKPSLRDIFHALLDSFEPSNFILAIDGAPVRQKDKGRILLAEFLEAVARNEFGFFDMAHVGKEFDDIRRKLGAFENMSQVTLGPPPESKQTGDVMSVGTSSIFEVSVQQHEDTMGVDISGLFDDPAYKQDNLLIGAATKDMPKQQHSIPFLWQMTANLNLPPTSYNTSGIESSTLVELSSQHPSPSSAEPDNEDLSNFYAPIYLQTSSAIDSSTLEFSDHPSAQQLNVPTFSEQDIQKSSNFYPSIYPPHTASEMNPSALIDISNQHLNAIFSSARDDIMQDAPDFYPPIYSHTSPGMESSTLAEFPNHFSAQQLNFKSSSEETMQGSSNFYPFMSELFPSNYLHITPGMEPSTSAIGVMENSPSVAAKRKQPVTLQSERNFSRSEIVSATSVAKLKRAELLQLEKNFSKPATDVADNSPSTVPKNKEVENLQFEKSLLLMEIQTYRQQILDSYFILEYIGTIESRMEATGIRFGEARRRFPHAEAMLDRAENFTRKVDMLESGQRLLSKWNRASDATARRQAQREWGEEVACNVFAGVIGDFESTIAYMRTLESEARRAKVDLGRLAAMIETRQSQYIFIKGNGKGLARKTIKEAAVDVQTFLEMVKADIRQTRSAQVLAGPSRVSKSAVVEKSCNGHEPVASNNGRGGRHGSKIHRTVYGRVVK
ncbi:hypothetical protein BC936DRAFT_148027 [Jimgerdemannia flammicorona]|uniref:Uncharacterized protein n=1 Tax=Jimgerdemannia flammicorona TaxID=994334 RepID=A0A433D3Z4_9FUNG|nr:hypothetical protein BC936DRAFT_148027 [Jimgerdemannia flammicorona]